MPELPEVECLSRAMAKVINGGVIEDSRFLRKDLRDPIPIKEFKKVVVGHVIEAVERRSKYMLLKTSTGYGIIHLGMTGIFVCQDSARARIDHTHAIFRVKTAEGEKRWLHYVDPRRFGRIACMEGHDLSKHKFFADLGPEPLEVRSLGQHLYSQSLGKTKPVKNFLMDPKIVVGVGNIYAAESLFKSKISPKRRAMDVSKSEFLVLSKNIKSTLRKAIKAGGTTFRDFKNVDGNPGYFALSLNVYNRAGKPCLECETPISLIRQSGRSSWFCPQCQT